MTTTLVLLQLKTPDYRRCLSCVRGGLRHLAHNGHIKGRSLRLPGAAISLVNVYIAGHDIGATTVLGGYKGKHEK